MNGSSVALIASLIVLGYAFLLAEGLIVPGLSLAGLVGFGCLGLAALMIIEALGTLTGTLITIGLITIGVALLIWLPRSPLGRPIIHRESLSDAHAADTGLTAGTTGIAESDLRPSGIVRFGEKRESVVTRGEYIQRGATVIIHSVEGGRIVVASPRT